MLETMTARKSLFNTCEYYLNMAGAANDMPCELQARNVWIMYQYLEAWEEMRETLQELRGNNGKATQQQAASFLLNLMGEIDNRINRKVGV